MKIKWLITNKRLYSRLRLTRLTFKGFNISPINKVFLCA
jgi:hypothetical protein